MRKVFADYSDHTLKWLAHRVQRPQEKINHALVLGGAQGIGKDTLLEPPKRAVGPWNFAEVSPQHMLGRFNGFLKSVILRVSEARDLGDVNRYQFYDHMKTCTAAPPDVLRVDEKNLREHSVLNCVGVIITTNHKADGIFLPAEDRRHFVAWSDLNKDDFAPDYWNILWRFYDDGGDRHVAAYLAGLDLSDFDPKGAPPKDCLRSGTSSTPTGPPRGRRARRRARHDGQPPTPTTLIQNHRRSDAATRQGWVKREEEPPHRPPPAREVRLRAGAQRRRQGRLMGH